VHFLTLQKEKLIRQQVARSDNMSANERMLIFYPSNNTTFQSFCKDSEQVVLFFRNISKTILAITSDYGIAIEQVEESFAVSVYYGRESSGPNAYPVCLSCKDAVISTNNYAASESRLGLLNDRLRKLSTDSCEISDLIKSSKFGTKAWIDCQARPILVATPKRHVHDMSELSDEELSDLWSTVGDLIAFMSKPYPVPLTWRVIHLNAGTYRNIEHLHVKLVFHAPEFLGMVSKWPSKYQDLVKDLQEIRRVMKLPDRQKLLDSIEGHHGTSKVKVVGVFDESDISELNTKFSKFGVVSKIFITKHSAIVEMESSKSAVEAILALNLTRLGRFNVSCKTKL
jgi:diadenosine tetraphosphate (Ap4A) HIT family hydrolase